MLDRVDFVEAVSYVGQIETLYSTFTEFTKANPVVGGMVGLWLMGVVTYLFRSIPMKLWNVIQRYTTVSVTLNNKHKSFHNLLKWYAKEKGVSSSRTIRISNGTYGWDETTVSLGLGNHYFMLGFRVFKLNRTIISSDGGDSVKEEIKISSLGFSQDGLMKLIDATIPDEKEDLPNIYVYQEGWVENQELSKRSWDSVILKKGKKESILEFIEEFDSSKGWYQEMGVSYKTGILFSGPPGTGKTSVIKALASHLKKNLCVMSCNSMTDEKFNLALSSTPKNSIVLLEDFDSISSTSDRSEMENGVIMSFGLTLSGMLNAIDGVFSSDGRILIGTTNHVEKLDPALLRPGRFDLKEVIDYADEDMVIRMFNKFYPDFYLDSIQVADSVSLAQVENCFLLNKKDPEKALIDVSKLEYRKRKPKKISSTLIMKNELPEALEDVTCN